MKRSIISAVLLSNLIFVSSASASWTRVYTMGEANLYMKDYANIWFFPSTVAQYPHLAILESERHYIGYPEYYEYYELEGGALLGLGRSGVFGFFVDQFSTSLPYASVYADTKFDLFYGTSLNNLDLGLNLYWQGGSSEWKDAYDADDDYHRSVSVIGGKGGLGTTYSGGKIEGTFWLEKTSFKNEQGREVISEPEGYRSFGILARVYQRASEELALVPFFGYRNIGQGASYPDTSYHFSKMEYKETGFIGGLGFDFMPQESILLVLHVGAEMSTEKETETPRQGRPEEEEEKFKGLPFYGLGIEADLTEWLTCRFGANKRIQSMEMTRTWTSDDETRTEEYKTSGALGRVYLGAGLNFGDWLFDVQVAEGFLHHGPNFLSGYEDAIFPMVSVTRKLK